MKYFFVSLALCVFLSSCTTVEEYDEAFMVSEVKPYVGNLPEFIDHWQDDEVIQATDENFLGMYPNQVAVCESFLIEKPQCRVINVLGYANSYTSFDEKRNCVWFRKSCIESLVQRVEALGGEVASYSRYYHLVHDHVRHDNSNSEVSWITIWTTLDIEIINLLVVPTYNGK